MIPDKYMEPQPYKFLEVYTDSNGNHWNIYKRNNRDYACTRVNVGYYFTATSYKRILGVCNQYKDKYL